MRRLVLKDRIENLCLRRLQRSKFGTALGLCSINLTELPGLGLLQVVKLLDAGG